MQDKSLGVRKLNSGILGASVANLSITGLQDDVIIYLKNTEPVPVSHFSRYKIQIDHQDDCKYSSHHFQITMRDKLMQPLMFYPKLQANFVSICVFWDFTLNGKLGLGFFTPSIRITF